MTDPSKTLVAAKRPLEIERMTRVRKQQLVLGALAVGVLILANCIVAVRFLGTGAGRTYRWVCRETGAELVSTPSIFRNAHLKPGPANSGGPYSWELVEPPPPSILLPWNWLARALDPPGPDPNKIVREWVEPRSSRR